MLKRWTKDCLVWKLGDDVYIQTAVKGIEYKHTFFQLNIDGSLLIKKGYAWNGCSPKFLFFGMVVGTPEGSLPIKKEKEKIIKNLQKLKISQFSWDRPKTYYASLVHDVFYQIAETKSANMSRSVVDILFLSLLRAYRFQPANIYYFVVKTLGCLCWGKISS